MSDTKREKLIEDLKMSLATIATERDALRKLMEQIEEMLDPIEAGISALEESIDAFSENRSTEMQTERQPWCPDVCPITLRPFFMWIEHPTRGQVPTYGGPFDSYTIPEPELPSGSTPRHEIAYYCERFDHDEGAWVDGSEDPGLRVISDRDTPGR